MTEAEWNTCADPRLLLDFLQDRASDRKLRLFLCACCHRLGHLLDVRGRAAVTVAEDYADGRAADGELEVAYEGMYQALDPAFSAWIARGYRAAGAARYWATCLAYSVTVSVVSAGAAEHAAYAVSADGMPADTALEMVPGYDGPAGRAEGAAQCRLLRDLFAPFAAPRVEPAWLAGCGGAVPGLARGIYEERAFERMPILADALEEAGCDHEGLLAHCRSGEGHVRGCWALDLLLGQS
jgi:hypothetical protein